MTNPQKKQAETYKMIPIVIFACLLMIIGIFLARSWKEQRIEYLQEQADALNAIQDKTYTINFNNLPIISNSSYKLYENKEDTQNLVVEFTVKDEKTIINKANGKELTSIQLENLDKIKSVRLDLSYKEKNITLMSADFNKDSTILNKIINIDFNSATGAYVLATPTTVKLSDEESGIHFFLKTSDSNLSTLDFPRLSENWRYKAVIKNSVSQVVYDIGTFQDPQKPDDLFKYSNNTNNLSFPGEDFVCVEKLANENPISCSGLDLNNGNYQIIISLINSEIEGIDLFELFKTDIANTVEAGKSTSLKKTFQTPYFELKSK